MENINFLALIVGALVPMVVGFIYYHEKTLGGAWRNSLGLSQEDLKSGNMAMIFGVSFLVSLLIAYNLYNYIGYHGVEEQTFTHSAFHGGMIALFTAVPVLISNSLFEKKNWTNIMINVCYWFVTFVLMGGVLSLFY